MDNSDIFNVGNGDAYVNVFQAIVPAFAFLIDCSSLMTVSTNHILTSFNAIRTVVHNYIVRSRPCIVAVILMATKKSDNAVNIKNICSIITPQLAGPEVMKKLDELIKTSQTDLFEKEYGTGDFCLSDALFIASTLLQEMKKKLKRQIVMFTNCQNPFPNPQDRVRVYSKMADFASSKTTFQVIPMGEGFDVQHYKELLELASSPECGPSVISVEDAVCQISAPSSRFRPLANLKLYITNELSVPVSITTLATRATAPISKAMSSATNAFVESKTVHKVLDYGAEPESGEDDSPAPASWAATTTYDRRDFLHTQTVGGKTIGFTAAEMDEINSYGSCELRLLGFKPKSSHSLQLHLQPCGFVYPLEATATGSRDLFSALMKRCEAKNVVAICSYCPRRTSTLRYVMLAPSAMPCGFLMIYLPFGDEVRDLDMGLAASGATTEQVEVMKKIVKKMCFSYKPENFPNPRLATHWAAVEAVALDKFEQEPVADVSMPNYDMLRSRLGDLPDVVMQEIYQGSYTPNSYSGLTKSRKEDALADIATVEEAYRIEMMEKLSVNQLKNYLKNVGKGAGLSKFKKGELITAVTLHIEKSHG